MNDFFTIFYRLLTRKNSPFRFTTVILALLIVATITVITLKLFSDDLELSKFTDKKTEIIVIIGMLVSMLVALPTIAKFLISEKEYRSFDDERDSTFTKQLREELDLEKKLNELLKETVTVNKIQEVVYDKTLQNVESSLLKKIEEKYEKHINYELKHNLISSQLNPIIRDTEKYIDKLQRNSIVNLIIGIIGTITAITILAITILDKNSESIEIGNFLIYFLPRLTFVVFIQLFAFFFLRLYKSNLEDAKYFQNELTNLNSKTSALKIAHLLGKDDKVDELIKVLSLTERNFKLNKEESLQILEKAKIEKDFDSNMLKAFSEFLKIYKKEE
ncbi:hypothetical protein QVZ41_13775 [Wenyingzhuangia sp. chi5]|uniref:MotA/TolQ/ExbB proton channel domain-containing protein n=1 Tax=Wenyingzhuangia gilva TaxID=3057677 RepID=A0ABT8VVA6_9FLAO|nr:hypothetical protein [Wenyingzhuangia sp. chi5]MDO3695915.1 hypothetical protein [Wenyingzhuangia sp. chi5]